MSTDYSVTLTASDGGTTKVVIIDSINPLPLSDSWNGDAAALGASTGKVASWGLNAAVLHTGPGATGNVTLDLFTKSTAAGDTGRGTKSSGQGSFPDGDLRWSCDAVDLTCPPSAVPV